MKVAVTSDLHFDVNQVDWLEMAKRQADYLLSQAMDLYVVAGDIFNDFDQSLAYIEKMQQLLGASCQVRFVAGNHDMLTGVTFDELETLNHPLYQHHRIDYFDEKVALIGNNGWYDYSFGAQPNLSAQDFLKWKKAFWIDGRIQQPLIDSERLELSLKQLRSDLASLPAELPKLVVTHFVPEKELIQLPRIKRENRHYYYEKFLGMLGSIRTGELLEEFSNVTCLYGHLHQKKALQELNKVNYLSSPVGYGTKRHFEWKKMTYLEQWKWSIQILTY